MNQLTGNFQWVSLNSRKISAVSEMVDFLGRIKGSVQTPRNISACEKIHGFLQHLSGSTQRRNTAKSMLSCTIAINGTGQSFLKFLKNNFMLLVRLWNAGASEKTIMVMINWNLSVSMNKVHNVLDFVYEKRYRLEEFKLFFLCLLMCVGEIRNNYQCMVRCETKRDWYNFWWSPHPCMFHCVPKVAGAWNMPGDS